MEDPFMVTVWSNLCFSIFHLVLFHETRNIRRERPEEFPAATHRRIALAAENFGGRLVPTSLSRCSECDGGREHGENGQITETRITARP